MNFAPSPVQLRWRDTARAFARERCAPLVRQADADGRFLIELVPEMGALGLLAGPVDAALGGSAMDYVSFALVYEELGYVDSSIRGFLAVHGGLVTLCLRDHGTAAQQVQWIPRLATGDAIGCYALTEDEAGSDAGAIRTTARRDGDDYVLDGRKIWITNGMSADVAIVFARDPAIQTDKPHRQICAFVVPTDTPGLRRETLPWHELGHRAADHAILSFEGCRVPAACLLGPPGGGFRVAMGALDHGRLGVAAGAVGVGRACLDASVDFARRRHAFGSRIGDFGMIQQLLADMHADVSAAALLVYQAAQHKDDGQPSTRATATAKLFACEAALRAADQAVLLHGGRGYSDQYPVARHWRDIKGLQIYEGTSHIQRLIIARDLLGPEPALPLDGART
ncbi:MAG: acyl-CoA dehydrogenase family protein [Ardenticatenales bacterium]